MLTHDYLCTATLNIPQAKLFLQAMEAGEIKIDPSEQAEGGPLIIRYAETGRALQSYANSNYYSNSGNIDVWGTIVSGLIQQGCEPWPMAGSVAGIAEAESEIADGRCASIFLMAAKQKNKELVNGLLSSPVAPRPSSLAQLSTKLRINHNEAQRSVLNFLVSEDELEMVRDLVRAGFHPDTRDASGYTPLMSANSAEMIRLLIEEGATPWIGTKDGRTLSEFWNERLSNSAAMEFGRAVSGAAKKQNRTDAAWVKGKLATLLRSPSSLRNVQAAIKEAGETLDSEIDAERPGVKISHIWACALAGQAVGANTAAAQENIERMRAYLADYNETRKDPMLEQDLNVVSFIRGATALEGTAAQRQKKMEQFVAHFEQRFEDGLLPAAMAISAKITHQLVPLRARTSYEQFAGDQNPVFSSEDRWMLTTPLWWQLFKHSVRVGEEKVIRPENDPSFFAPAAYVGRFSEWNDESRKAAWLAILPLLNANIAPNMYGQRFFPKARCDTPEMLSPAKHPLHGLAAELLNNGDVWDMDAPGIKERLEAVNKGAKGQYGSDVSGDAQLYEALKRGYENKVLERMVAQPGAVRRNRM